MKKKQLAKLKKQFRPSFDTARQMLFTKIEEKTVENYGLPTKVSINPKKQDEMTIELLSDTRKEPQISVPLDENFTIVIKRIQKQEKGLLERFSNNLVEEIAAYWATTEPTQSAVTETEVMATEVAEEAPALMVQEPLVEPVQSGNTTDTFDFASFKEAILAFPKFDLIEADQQIEIVEKTPKENRLLATISTNEAGVYTIETALERKYKLKLEVIPVIERFANTPLNAR